MASKLQRVQKATMTDDQYIRNTSDERVEFLMGQREEAISYASYWCHVSGYAGNTPIVRAEDGIDYSVTLHAIARGYAMLSNDQANYRNSGYDVAYHGSDASRIRKFNVSNGMDSDADALDSDAALQCALFGEVVYG